MLTFGLIAMGQSTLSCKECDSCGSQPDELLPQYSEDNVLYNFKIAYRRKQVDEYTKLLATDFRFYLDPVTAKQVGAEYWTRTQDSLATERLFSSPQITKVVIELQWPTHSATNAGLPPPRDTWTKLFVTDVYLDADYAPAGQDTTTFRVANQTQRFFFRRGRTSPPSGPADTLVYLVEWRDQGVAGGGANARTLVAPSTWSLIKSLLGPVN